MQMDFIYIVLIIVFASSLVHGSIGFGFGMIATPLIALYSDLQTAIILLVIPTMLVNIISIYSEGEFFKALKKFSFIIFLMILGSSLGTVLLIYFNSEFFKVLLAFIILIYLFQSLIKIRITFIATHPKTSTYALGLVGGIFSGLTNVVAPFMIMYTLELKYSRKDAIQLSNLCFLFTKIGQIIVLVSYGAFSSGDLKISIFELGIVLFAMYLGIKIKKMIDAKFYTIILKVLLFIISLGLIVQSINF